MQTLSSYQPLINSTIQFQSPKSNNFTKKSQFSKELTTTHFNSCSISKRVSFNSKFKCFNFVGFCNHHSFSNFRSTHLGNRNMTLFGSLGYVNCNKVCSFMYDGLNLSSGLHNSLLLVEKPKKFRVFRLNSNKGCNFMCNSDILIGKQKKVGIFRVNSGKICNFMCDGSSSSLGVHNSDFLVGKQMKFGVFSVNSSNVCKFMCDRLGLEYDNLDNIVEKKKGKGFRVNSVARGSVNELVGSEMSGNGEEMEKYDAIVIGSGIGGLVAATQLAVKGAKVLVLEKYVIPGGSSGFYERDGYTFDVGSSVMFGFSDKGNLNLITQALAAVGHKMEVIPDPTTVHFHLPNNLSVQVHRHYDDFITELTSKFPHEKEGILKFYGECWKIFNALNSLELKSLEEPLYLFGQFFQKPLECSTLAFYLPQNAGEIARKYVKDPDLLSFIDAECFIVSTVNALQTPMINASMVLCDRHFGGINYPVGGVGGIAKSLVQGLVDRGSKILYKANVTSIILEHGKAVGVRLSDKREFYARTVISNATRWDTFGKLLKSEKLPEEEENFQKLYVQAPSFLSIHMGVKAEVLPPDTDCHHFVLETDWKDLEKPYGSIFLSIPTILDSSLAPKGHHILHIFTTSSINDWQGLSPADYNGKKELTADEIINRLEKKLFPGLKSSITFKEVGTPKTHRRYLARDNGTYGPMPRAVPKGLLGMPFNTTAIDGLYCVGDSCFPGQGVIAVAFSGIMCAHRVAADIGFEKSSPVLDSALLRLLGWFRTLA